MKSREQVTNYFHAIPTQLKPKWKFLLASTLLLTVATSSYASDWSTQDIALESAFLGLWIIDWRQTRTIIKDPELAERNIILGRNPSLSEVDYYFLSGAILHLIISNALNPQWTERYQIFTIGNESAAVINNFGLGIKMDF